jgi:hypothetical protein
MFLRCSLHKLYPNSNTDLPATKEKAEICRGFSGRPSKIILPWGLRRARYGYMDMLAEAVFIMPCIVPFAACKSTDQNTCVDTRLENITC